MTKFSEFFQDVKGGLSMGRLLVFGSYVVTSFIMVKLVLDGKMSEGYLGIYIGAFVTNFVLTKAADTVEQVKGPKTP